MLERLPTPWGLVRLGVAPDHPKLKTVSRAFERIADKPGFRFVGNVEIGRDLHHDDLVRLYDAVVYAVGAQTDRRLGIPGEDLPGSWSAFEFVAWYNGHPDYQDLPFDLDVERAVVIGNGNVALDVARMLALTPEELAPTDTTDPAIEAISRVASLGDRRRSAGAARPRPRSRRRSSRRWASSPAPTSSSIRPSSTARAEERGHARQAQPRGAARLRGARADGQAEDVALPLPRVAGRDPRRRACRGDRDRAQPARGARRPASSRSPTDEHETIPCGLVFRSVGYRGVGAPGRPVRRARAARSATTAAASSTTTGGTSPASTAPAGSSAARPGSSARTRRTRPRPSSCCSRTSARAGSRTREHARPKPSTRCSTSAASRRVVYTGWLSIDALERSRGEPLGRPRVKLVDLGRAARRGRDGRRRA